MGKKVCILGLGKSGVVAARHALAAGDDVTIYGGKSSAGTLEAAREFQQAGVPVLFDTEDVEGDFDLCVASPGIPQTGAFYRNAAKASTELVSEPEYAWRLSPHGWVAITGTNGKTTTTSLTAFLLNECGILASACGNIGDTALAAVEERREGEVLVAELSSFQIASMHRFAPEIAVLLNITPDHVSWHGSFEAYAQAKYQLFDNMGAGSTAVIVAGTLGGDELMATLRDRGVRVVLANSDSGDNCAYLDAQGRITVKLDGEAHVLCKADELQIKGSHNVENALAAAAVACASGCDDARIAAALKAFGALEHRIEPCGTVDGVAFFNDSKATNTDATLKALTAFGQGEVVLLLGGRDKGTSLDELVAACAGVCTDVICYGEAGERFFDAFADSPVARTRAATMREAFDKAVEFAKSGQAVVLSPACASFDEFDSYGQRGKTFKAYVADLAARKG